MIALLVASAAASATLKFKDTKGLCTMQKDGNVIKSTCQIVDPFHYEMKQNMVDHKSRIDQLDTRVTKLEKSGGVAASDLEAVATAFCPLKITGTNMIFSLAGKRTHEHGFCKFNCKTGTHDADADNTCVACSTVSCSHGYYRHSTKCSTTEHHKGQCAKTDNYCPDVASIEHGSVSVSGRKIGSTATITCKSGAKATGTMTATCKASTAGSGKWDTGDADCDVNLLTYIGSTTWVQQYRLPYATQNSRMNTACSNSWRGSRAMSFNEHLLNPKNMPATNPTGRWLTFTTSGQEGKGGWTGGSGNWWTNCHNNHNCLNCYNPGSRNMHSGDSNKKNLCHTSGRGAEHPSYPGKCTDIGGCWSNTRGVLCVSTSGRRLLQAPAAEVEELKSLDDYGPVNLD
jgi:hypothetical protein